MARTWLELRGKSKPIWPCRSPNRQSTSAGRSYLPGWEAWNNHVERMA